MASSIPNFPIFDLHTDEHSIGIRWKKYVAKLENLFVGLNIDKNKRKKALLLHYAGDDVFEIYETLGLRASDDNYEETKTTLTNYFHPKKNTEFERYEFRNAKQNTGESVDQYVTKLRQKAANCEFHDKDGEIKSQLIQGCLSERFRRKCLEEDKPLSELLTMARTMDIASRQAKSMQQNGHVEESVDKIYRKFSSQPKPTSQRQPTPSGRQQKCKNCGGDYPHKSRCPAIGMECFYCHKRDHFISVCRKRITQKDQRRPVHEIYENDCDLVDTDNISDTELSFGINANVSKINLKVPKRIVKINGLDTNILIDTGSSINIVDEKALGKMKPTPKLEKCKTRAFAFGQTSALPIKGKFKCTVESDTKYTTTEFYVVNGNANSILSYDTSVELGIIPAISLVEQEHNYSGLYEEFPSVFSGLGKLKDIQVKFHIDESITPVAQPPRRIPFHVRDQVEQELDRLEKMDVIEKVEGATPWVSNLVVAPKPKSPGEIRIFVDMRQANQAVRRERHVTPTVDDIILNLNGSSVFSKVDLYKGFHQIEIAEESRNMTTFATHVGLRRYKRLNFGVSAAPEMFQNEIRQSLEGLNGVLNISDDIIIHGKSRKEHDEYLRALLQRLQEKNLTLNKQKCMFGQSKITFYGYVFSESGISPDPEKIKALKNVDRPSNQSEVRSFLGMTNYLSRFIDNYSSMTEPLRQLMKQDVKFEWTEKHEKSFSQLKNILSSEKVMTYFDPHKQTELWVDASPVGVSGILIQNNKVVSYGSKSLSATEQRYSQTEREALACVWGCEHFHLYLFGKEFTLITDHRPLESIFNNVKKIQSARLERWRLRLTTYNYIVKYRPGHIMISDYLSRHPDQKHASHSIAEDYVKFIAQHALPNSLRLSEVASATADDCVIAAVINALQSNNWDKQTYSNDDSFRCYKQLSNELAIVHVEEGTILLRGTRLCIPETLQQCVVNLAHEGHQGRVRSKLFLRESCWFPYMDRLIDEACKNCLPCQAASPTSTPDPIKISPLPSSIFWEISVDFCGPFPTGEYYMVVIDDYSRYPIVERITSVSAQTVIPRLEAVFAMFGIPNVVRTDNGPPFHGHIFKEFSVHAGFTHRKITPLHPMGNSIVERFMKPLQKAIKTAAASGHNHKMELNQFLMNYRNTPHPATNMAPAEIMFGRKLKTKLPKFSVKRKDNNVRARDRSLKLKNKQYADEKRKAEPCSLKIGDNVLIKRQHFNKLQTVFDPTPGKIVKRKGSMITIEHRGRLVTRDASHFKYVNTGPATPVDRGVLTSPELPRRSSRIRRPPAKYRK